MEPIEGISKISFGLVMLAEAVLIIALLVHLMHLTRCKMKRLNHEHVTWYGGQVFLAYLSLILIFNLLDALSIAYSYLSLDVPISFISVTFRVASKTLLMLAKLCLWYYTTKHSFDLFTRNNYSK